VDSKLDQSVRINRTFSIEQRLFSIRLLADDPHLNLRANPIDTQDPQALYKRCQDGILLW
jgi:hypothetical protein